MEFRMIKHGPYKDPGSGYGSMMWQFYGVIAHITDVQQFVQRSTAFRMPLSQLMNWGQENSHQFADNIFAYTFVIKFFFWVLITISMTFVDKGQIDKKSVLVLVDDKPLSQPMMAWFTNYDELLQSHVRVVRLINAFTFALFTKWLLAPTLIQRNI